jgi:hypothetical protein
MRVILQLNIANPRSARHRISFTIESTMCRIPNIGVGQDGRRH